MKSIIAFLMGLVISTSTFAFGDCKLEITFAMNKSNPPSYTFKALPAKEGAKYYWVVGDKTYNDIASVTHTFARKGDYLITVKAKSIDGSYCIGELKANFEGEISTTANTVLSGKGKVKNYAEIGGCGLLIVLENGQILNPLENIPNFLLKDGQSIELAYEVLKDRLTNCMKGTSVKILKIAELVTTQKCKAYFFATPDRSNPNKFIFTNKSEGNIIEYGWSFNDGVTSKDKDFSREFKNGTYKACLKIKTSDGCSSDYCAEIKVGTETTTCKLPIYIKKSGTDPVKYSFYTDNQVTGAKYYWYFGDGGKSELQSPDYNFNSSGTWVVNLKVLLPDNKVCYGELKETFVGKVSNACKAGFIFSYDATTPKKILFTNKSEGELLEVFWMFGDGISSNEKTPSLSYVYTKDGVYKVCLKTKNSNGCVGEYCAEIRIGNVPTTDANTCTFNLIARQKIGSGNTFMFYTETKSIVKSRKWSFGDGATSISELETPEYTYKNPGTYEVKCTIETSTGCTETKILKLVVYNNQLPVCKGSLSLILVDPEGELCTGKATAKLLDEKSAEIKEVKYLWSNGLTENSVLNLCPNKTYSVQVINGNICQKNTSFTMITRPVWKTSAFNGTNYFSVISPSEGVLYEWDFGDGNKKQGTEVDYNFSKEGVYNVTLKAAVGYEVVESKQQVVVMNGITGTVVIDKSEINIYPNPVSDYLKIKLGNPVNDDVMVEINDINGKNAYTQKVNSTGNNEISLNLQHLKSGIYFLKLSHKEVKLSDFKFIKTE